MAYPVRRVQRTPYRPAYEPLAELAALRREMSRMLAALSGGRDAGALADIEFTQDDEGWTVTARLPGVAPEEVQIEVDEREVCIQVLGEAEEDQTERPLAYDYRLALPGEVDPDRVEATMDHGLLTVHLPRSARSARRKITVGRPDPA